MSTKATLGCFGGIVWCVITSLALEFFLLPIVLKPGVTFVPYGSAMPIPLFYSGILGAVIGCVIHLIMKGQSMKAAVTAMIGSAFCAGINLSFWFDSGYPLTHYSNLIIFAPIVGASTLVFSLGIILVVHAWTTRNQKVL